MTGVDAVRNGFIGRLAAALSHQDHGRRREEDNRQNPRLPPCLLSACRSLEGFLQFPI